MQTKCTYKVKEKDIKINWHVDEAIRERYYMHP